MKWFEMNFALRLYYRKASLYVMKPEHVHGKGIFFPKMGLGLNFRLWLPHGWPSPPLAFTKLCSATLLVLLLTGR